MIANRYIREIEVKFKGKKKEKIQIKSVDDVYKLFKDMEDCTQEKLVALHLDGNNDVVCFQVVHIGTINSAIIRPADILKTALLTNACNLIIIHNHPSGSCKPSLQDKETTNILINACKVFNIHLLDHIIVGNDMFYSFISNKLMV